MKQALLNRRGKMHLFKYFSPSHKSCAIVSISLKGVRKLYVFPNYLFASTRDTLL